MESVDTLQSNIVNISDAQCLSVVVVVFNVANVQFSKSLQKGDQTIGSLCPAHSSSFFNVHLDLVGDHIFFVNVELFIVFVVLVGVIFIANADT